MDTIGTEESVLIREVSSFQGLNYMYVWERKVLLLEKCPPHFGGVLKEGFHCMYVIVFVGYFLHNT